VTDPRDRYFEDFDVGRTYEFGSYTVTEEEILTFGRAYDPQPFHTDPQSAVDSIFGGIIASGWHTAAMSMRLMVDNFISPLHSLGSPGIDELRFTAPVRPGAELRVRITVEELRPSASKPDRGLIRQHLETVDVRDPQHPQTVMTAKTLALWRRRPADGSAPGGTTARR
jgi:acyl dehydratase